MTEEVRKDACGQDLKLGDMVAYVDPFVNILREGYTIKVTSKGFSISEKKGGKYLINRSQNQIVKLPPELRLERLLEN